MQSEGQQQMRVVSVPPPVVRLADWTPEGEPYAEVRRIGWAWHVDIHHGVLLISDAAVCYGSRVRAERKATEALRRYLNPSVPESFRVRVEDLGERAE